MAPPGGVWATGFLARGVRLSPGSMPPVARRFPVTSACVPLGRTCLELRRETLQQVRGDVEAPQLGANLGDDGGFEAEFVRAARAGVQVRLDADEFLRDEFPVKVVVEAPEGLSARVVVEMLHRARSVSFVEGVEFSRCTPAAGPLKQQRDAAPPCRVAAVEDSRPAVLVAKS